VFAVFNQTEGELKKLTINSPVVRQIDIGDKFGMPFEVFLQQPIRKVIFRIDRL
jgi:hypothetical protein